MYNFLYDVWNHPFPSSLKTIKMRYRMYPRSTRINKYPKKESSEITPETQYQQGVLLLNINSRIEGQQVSCGEFPGYLFEYG